MIYYNSERLDKLLASKGETLALWNAPRENLSMDNNCTLSPELIRALEEDSELIELVKKEIHEIRQETLRKLFELIFTNGRHPNRVIPNIYALTLLACPALMEGFTLTDIAELNSTTRQAECIRLRKWMTRLGSGKGRHFSHPRKNVVKTIPFNKTRSLKSGQAKARQIPESEEKKSAADTENRIKEEQLILPIKNL